MEAPADRSRGFGERSARRGRSSATQTPAANQPLTNPYRSPSPVGLQRQQSPSQGSSLLLILGLLIGVELVAAPLLLGIGLFFGPGLLGDPRLLAGILMVTSALATGILFRRYAGLITSKATDLETRG